MWGWRVIGAVFVLSGTINLFGFGEDLPAIFARMAAGNAATRLAPVSALIAANPGFATGLAAGVMLATGLAQMAGGTVARLAGIGQLVMMLAFVTLLHRAFPEVILADGALALAMGGLLAAHRGQT